MAFSSILDPPPPPSRASSNPTISPVPSPSHPPRLPPIPSSPPSPSSSPLLSNLSSFGFSSSKITKRKPRGSSKPPIKFFSADVDNFMDMVQSLTGLSSDSHLPFAPPAQDPVLAPPLSAGSLDPSVVGSQHSIAPTPYLIKESNNKPCSKALGFSRFKPLADHRLRPLDAIGTMSSIMERGRMTPAGSHSVCTAMDSSRPLVFDQHMGHGTSLYLPYPWDGSKSKDMKQEPQYPWDESEPGQQLRQESNSDEQRQQHGTLAYGGGIRSGIDLLDGRANGRSQFAR